MNYDHKNGSLGILALGDAGLRIWRKEKFNIDFKEFDKADNKARKKLLLIGWDAADWKIINPLIDRGLMPSLEKLINSGVMGNIATLDPPLSPILWTSIATGKRADKHGILGFAEPDLKTGTVRPISNLSRKVHAVWNILNSQGLKTNIVGWWPSHPAEPLDGVMVSNHFYNLPQESKDNEVGKKSWKLLKGSVYPADKAQQLFDLRVHPSEINQEHLLPFVPNAQFVNQEVDKSLHSIAKNLAHTASVQAVATHLMQYTEWDFQAVYFDSIDHFCHGFMKYHPPRMNGVPDREFALYQHVVNSAYIFHDMMLGRMLDLIDDNTSVILLSDHGFHSDHLRPNYIPTMPAGPALEHNPYGMVVINGDGIRKDARVYGASLLDIAPTILSLFDLPVGKDMDGKVLKSIFEGDKKIDVIESWEMVEGDFHRHPEFMEENTQGSMEAINQLVELGYIDSPGDDGKSAMEKTINELNYNLSRVYIGKGELLKAREILEQLIIGKPDDIRFNLDLFDVYNKLKMFEKASDIIMKLKTIKEKAIPRLKILEAITALNLKKFPKALKLLKEVESDGGNSILVMHELARTYLAMRKYSESANIYSKILGFDPDNARSYHGLAICQLRMGDFEESASNSLNAIGLIYNYPSAHYHLGEALYNMKLYEESLKAFQVCVVLAPKMTKANDWIRKIVGETGLKLTPNEELREIDNYRSEKIELDYSLEKEFFEVPEHEVITVVSGLPRSGTSMMMQVLEAGGMPVFTDSTRLPDENNPRGYFEFEPVKSLYKDNSWIPQAKGKVIKIVAPLLQYLPSNLHYKVVFMNRDMGEILKSQQKMLNKDSNTFNTEVAEIYRKEVERARVWGSKEPNVKWMDVDYANFVNSPDEGISALTGFIGSDMDLHAMKSAVINKLYRNRK